MRPGTRAAVLLGMRRGLIEVRHTLTNAADVTFILVNNVAYVVVMIFQRDSSIPGTGISLAAATLPGLIGMNLVVGGWLGTVTTLSAEREDGTLLRAKATPDGMVGYLVARVTQVFLNTGFGLLIFLVVGVFFVAGLSAVGPVGWLLVAALFVLGILATLPWGAMVGALVRNAGVGFGISFLPMAALIGISGIFYPIAALPGWLQSVAQVFPVYWLGLGMRSALLPGAAAAAEIGDSWRHLETFGVLGLWAVVGLALAPRVLRRMARRESGSTVDSRRPLVAGGSAA